MLELHCVAHPFDRSRKGSAMSPSPDTLPIPVLPSPRPRLTTAPMPARFGSRPATPVPQLPRVLTFAGRRTRTLSRAQRWRRGFRVRASRVTTVGAAGIVSARQRRDGARSDAGMSTAEYAIGTVAACAFAALLYKVITSQQILDLLTGVVSRALRVPF
jgi:hypothetical protein